MAEDKSWRKKSLFQIDMDFLLLLKFDKFHSSLDFINKIWLFCMDIRAAI
jgi:hypothetical protein